TKQIGIHDNFFELGGDSLLTLQVAIQARQAGLYLRPQQLLQYQTLAELAPPAKTDADLNFSEKSEGVGVELLSEPMESVGESGWLPMLPVQLRFFDLKPTAPHHWNVAFYVEVDPKKNVDLLTRAVEIVINHHDALRTQFIETETCWRSRIVEASQAIPFEHHDLTQVEDAEVSGRLTPLISALQLSLDIVQGPIIRFAYFSLPDQLPDRLVMLCNHLVMDGWARQIVLQDLLNAYAALAAGRPVELPAKTTSMRKWTCLL